jgi:homocysteine S-methyltransferase
VLDGGLATELERRGHDLSSMLWSARLLVDDPSAILDVHRAYFRAGAEIATSASYQASFTGFAACGYDRNAAADLMRRSVGLAREARDEVGRGWVAASIGPYGAALADGSEYRGDYGLTVADLRRFHRPRLQVLADSGADFLAVETVPCQLEVEAIVAELGDLGVPAWISLTAAGGRTRAGEPLEAALRLAASSTAVFAVGVNCMSPVEVAEAANLAASTGKPVVTYPNSGEEWNARTRTWTGSPALSAGTVDSWLNAGARIVGGCCRVGPEQIASISRAIAAGGGHRTDQAPRVGGDLAQQARQLDADPHGEQAGRIHNRVGDAPS